MGYQLASLHLVDHLHPGQVRSPTMLRHFVLLLALVALPNCGGVDLDPCTSVCGTGKEPSLWCPNCPKGPVVAPVCPECSNCTGETLPPECPETTCPCAVTVPPPTEDAGR